MDSKPMTFDGVDYLCTLRTEPQPAPLVLYSQRDPRWANLPYNTGSTFAKNGCLVCCVAMVVSAAYPEEILPPEVAASLKRAGCFVGDFLSRPSRIPDAYPRLSWDGVVHWRDKPADMAFLRSELATYGCAIAEVKWNPNGPQPQTGNQHFIIVESLTGDDANIIDPWDGKRKLLNQSRYSVSGHPAASWVITGLRLVHPESNDIL